MSRFLSRELLHTGPRRCTAAALLHNRRRLQTPLARCLSQSPDTAVAVTNPSLTLSFLIHSCGLSLEAALPASEKVRIGSTDNPNAVLGFLRDSGFSASQVAAIVFKLPSLLRMSIAKTLRPKMECLRGAGISGPRLPELLCMNPYILTHSLTRKIAPSLEILHRELAAGGAVCEALRFSIWLMPENQLTNVQTLRRRGVPDARISKLLLTKPQALARPSAWFEEAVAAVEAMGLDPANPMFPPAVGVMAYMSKEAWDRKLAVYRSLGWSDAEVSSAFLKQPFVLALSDESIRQKVEFFAGKLGMDRTRLCRHPVLLLLSLEKRVAPRCAVLKVLVDRGVLREGQLGLVSVLKMPEKGFLERFVTRYREEAPDVVDAHLGKVEFSGFGTLARTAEEPPCVPKSCSR